MPDQFRVTITNFELVDNRTGADLPKPIIVTTPPGYSKNGYPGRFTVTKDLLSTLKRGQVIELVKGNPSKPEPRYDSDYYYNIRLPQNDQPPIEPPAVSPTVNQPPDARPPTARVNPSAENTLPSPLDGEEDEPVIFSLNMSHMILEKTDLAIMRQVALKEISAWLLECVRVNGLPSDAEIATRFQFYMRLLMEGK